MHHVIGVSTPASAAEVELLVRSAVRHHVAVNLVSTGKNGGYGSGGPPTQAASWFCKHGPASASLIDRLSNSASNTADAAAPTGSGPS